jgi:tRNA threonylcarbamoyladenosine biosynthesis protein TsaE
LADERATQALAAQLAHRARQGDVIALQGPLGSGKTSFARAFIRARFAAVAEVPSPTFALVEVYDGDGPAVWHFDLFRLDKPAQAWELGIEDAFADGIAVIEWPERLGSLLPREHLALTLGFGASPTARVATLAASPAWASRLTGLGHG